MQNQNLLSMTDAAQRRAVPVGDIRKAIEAGELAAEERGGEYFIRPEELERWTPHVKSATGADFTDAEAADYLRTPGTPK